MAKAIQTRTPKVIKTEDQLALELEKSLAKKELIAKIKNQKDILEVRLHPLKSGKEASETRLEKLKSLNDFVEKLNKEEKVSEDLNKEEKGKAKSTSVASSKTLTSE